MGQVRVAKGTRGEGEGLCQRNRVGPDERVWWQARCTCVTVVSSGTGEHM